MRNASKARGSAPENHYAKLVQIRVSERAKEKIAQLANSLGLSEAAYLRGVLYEHLGLNVNDKEA